MFVSMLFMALCRSVPHMRDRGVCPVRRESLRRQRRGLQPRDPSAAPTASGEVILGCTSYDLADGAVLVPCDPPQSFHLRFWEEHLYLFHVSIISMDNGTGQVFRSWPSLMEEGGGSPPKGLQEGRDRFQLVNWISNPPKCWAWQWDAIFRGSACHGTAG